MNADVAIQWRAITTDDGPGWARLLLAVEESYGTEDIVGAEDLVEDLRDPHVNPERGTIAAFSQRSILAYAGLRASPSVTSRHEMGLYGAVHPSQRGRGLGTGPLPEAARIAGYTAELSQAARRVRDDAFGDHRGSTPATAESWQHFVGPDRFRPAFSFLAYLAEEPAGVLIAQEYDAFAQATGRRECYIATVGVIKAARGRGIASALIRRSLAAAKADGCNVATLYADADSQTGALTLFEHAGFTKQRTSVTLIKDLTDK